MVFKFIGVVLLLLGAYLAIDAFTLTVANDQLRAQVYPLIAVFLVLAVRVLQAEKHRRDRRTD